MNSAAWVAALQHNQRPQPSLTAVALSRCDRRHPAVRAPDSTDLLAGRPKKWQRPCRRSTPRALRSAGARFGTGERHSGRWPRRLSRTSLRRLWRQAPTSRAGRRRCGPRRWIEQRRRLRARGRRFPRRASSRAASRLAIRPRAGRASEERSGAKPRSTALLIADSRAPRRRAGPRRYLCSGDRTPRGAVAAPAAAVALGLGAEAHVRLRIAGLLRSVELERVEQGGRDSKSESAPPPSSRARSK
jgi:hypothetical protein